MLIFSMLLGCPYVGPAAYTRVEDVDGDNIDAIRFGGRDCDDSDPAVGDCDLDRDGFASTAVGGDDCDDSTAAVNPDQPEICDGIDNDCDGQTDDADPDVTDPSPFFADDDGDDYGAGQPLFACTAPPGFVMRDDDCNDDFASIHPGVPERCDQVDWNCDGEPIEGAIQDWFADEDEDGYGDPSTPVAEGCDQPEGAVSNPHDCDDTNALAHPIGFETPDTTEICDGIDNDCDGLFDADDPGLDPDESFLLFPDLDGDGFGDPLGAEQACATDPSFVDNGLDCDDSDPLARPSAPPVLGSIEICDGFDNDCNGLIDEADPGLDLDSAFLLSVDGDGDGFGDSIAVPLLSCAEVSGLVANQADCDDTDVDVTLGPLWYPDLDGDNAGATGGALQACEQTGIAGFVLNDDDCNDLDATIQSALTSWFFDGDGDGHGDPNDSTTTCFPPIGYVSSDADCNDLEGTIHPDAAELCDNVDNNCDGAIDNAAPGSAPGFLDLDGDGYGAGPLGDYCQGVSSNSLDCDDSEGTTHPFAPEVCDSVDNDCDGLVDEDDPDVILEHFYADDDLDGFGDPTTEVLTCTRPPTFVEDGTDCAPDNPAQYFSTYFIDGGTGPQHVASLTAALDHGGRCPEDLEVITTFDLVLGADLYVGGHLRIEGVGSPPPSLTISAGTDLQFEGLVELENLELIAPGAHPNGVFTAVGSSRGGGLELIDLVLETDIQGPLVGVFVEGPDQEAEVLIRGLRLQSTDLGGLVVMDGIDADVLIQDTVLSSAHLTAPLVRMSRATDLSTLGAALRLEDVVLTNTTLDPSGASQPLIWTEGGVDVDLTRTTIVDLTLRGPLICAEGVQCIGDGRASDVATSPTDNGAGLSISFSEFAEINSTDPDTPWMIWQPSWLSTLSTANTYRDTVSANTDLLYVRNELGDQSQLLSLRDRFIRARGDIRPVAITPQFLETFFVESTMGIGRNGTGIVLDEVAFIEGAVDVLSVDYTLDRAVVIGGTWPFQPPTAAVGTIYHLPGVVPPYACDDCELMDLVVDPFVSYDDGLPSERVIPFPKLPPVGLPPDDLPFEFGAADFASGGVQWHLDPNQDGLPSAWVVFHASVASCLGKTDALIDPAGDPDGDGVPNTAEYTAGTWPCIADTDDDGFPDGATDAFPLDRAAH